MTAQRPIRRYRYLGDRLTDPRLILRECEAVTREDGRCICGRLGTMLVRFEGENFARVILRRRLRKL